MLSEADQRLLELRIREYSLTQISDELGYSKSTVSGRVKKLLERYDEVQKLPESGLPPRYLSEKRKVDGYALMLEGDFGLPLFLLKKSLKSIDNVRTKWYSKYRKEVKKMAKKKKSKSKDNLELATSIIALITSLINLIITIVGK